MNSKKIGNQWEQKLCQQLSDEGYWVYLTPYNETGQPCDVIAIKNDEAILLDVKHCKTNNFTFDRLEPNQETCFKYAIQCGIKRVGLAIYFDNEHRFKYLSFKRLEQFIEKGMKHVNSSELILLDNVL